MALAGLAALPGGCAWQAPDPATLPRTYLVRAQQAVASRDGAGALAALDDAVALWRGTNPGPVGRISFIVDPVLQDMLLARQAIGMGRWRDARYYIATALNHPSTITPP